MKITITEPDWDGPSEYEWAESRVGIVVPDETVAKWEVAKSEWDKVQRELHKLCEKRNKRREQARAREERKRHERDRLEVERLRRLAHARQPDELADS